MILMCDKMFLIKPFAYDHNHYLTFVCMCCFIMCWFSMSYLFVVVLKADNDCSTAIVYLEGRTMPLLNTTKYKAIIGQMAGWESLSNHLKHGGGFTFCAR